MSDMKNSDMDRGTLAAFVDGELSPEDAARVVLHLADHAQDRAYVDQLRATQDLLGHAFDAPVHEPVPEQIARVIQGHEAGAKVVPFPTRLRRVLPLAGAAMAATVALVIGLQLGGGRSDDQMHVATGPVQEGTELHASLETALTGETRPLGVDADIVPMASFRDADGRACREFEVMVRDADILEHGVACKAAGDWVVVAAIVRSFADIREDGYVAASGGQAPDILEQTLDALGAGLVLGPQDEADLMARGWSD